jgi:hypothetical protein
VKRLLAVLLAAAATLAVIMMTTGFTFVSVVGSWPWSD